MSFAFPVEPDVKHRPALLRIWNGSSGGEAMMDGTLTLIDLAGSIALLLWGVHMVQSGVQRAFGPNLRRVLGAALGNRFKAFLAGLGITAVLQSSTATGLMVTGFAAGGLVDLVPGLAAMLGANVGTTLIVQVLSFDISRVAPLFVLIGVMMFRRGGITRTRDLGRVGIGLGLILIALSQLLAILTPYRRCPEPAAAARHDRDGAGDRRDRRGGFDLGRAFERRNRLADDVVCRARRGAAAGGVCPRPRRQSRHRPEPAVRGRLDRRPLRQAAADR